MSPYIITQNKLWSCNDICRYETYGPKGDFLSWTVALLRTDRGWTSCLRQNLCQRGQRLQQQNWHLHMSSSRCHQCSFYTLFFFFTLSFPLNLTMNYWNINHMKSLLFNKEIYLENTWKFNTWRNDCFINYWVIHEWNPFSFLLQLLTKSSMHAWFCLLPFDLCNSQKFVFVKGNTFIQCWAKQKHCLAYFYLFTSRVASTCLELMCLLPATAACLCLCTTRSPGSGHSRCTRERTLRRTVSGTWRTQRSSPPRLHKSHIQSLNIYLYLTLLAIEQLWYIYILPRKTL